MNRRPQFDESESPKRTDNRKVVNATQLTGEVAVYNVENASGSAAYNKDVHNAAVENKLADAKIISVCHIKNPETGEPEFQGRDKNVPRETMIGYSTDMDMLKINMEVVATAYSRFTVPYNGDKSKKVKAKSGRATQSNRKLQEFISLEDTVGVVTSLYKDLSDVEDDELAEIVAQYFVSPFEEVKELLIG